MSVTGGDSVHRIVCLYYLEELVLSFLSFFFFEVKLLQMLYNTKKDIFRPPVGAHVCVDSVLLTNLYFIE